SMTEFEQRHESRILASLGRCGGGARGGLRRGDDQLSMSTVVLDAHTLVVFIQWRLTRAIRPLLFVIPTVLRRLAGYTMRRNRDGERPRVHRRIGEERAVDVVIIVLEGITLHDVHILAGEFSRSCEARLGIVILHVDDERVALPV